MRTQFEQVGVGSRRQGDGEQHEPDAGAEHQAAAGAAPRRQLLEERAEARDRGRHPRDGAAAGGEAAHESRARRHSGAPPHRHRVAEQPRDAQV